MLGCDTIAVVVGGERQDVEVTLLNDPRFYRQLPDGTYEANTWDRGEQFTPEEMVGEL